MLPLIRNVLFATIAVIALIVALANMGMNVPSAAGRCRRDRPGHRLRCAVAGGGPDHRPVHHHRGLLSIDDYVDVGGHLGTVVEGLTIRTVRLRDLDGVVHTIPFSEIKSIKNYSRQFGYAINPAGRCRRACRSTTRWRWCARSRWSAATRRSTATCGRRWNCRGVESFDNGQAILRFRFKTAPIKQWEVQRAFNLRLRRRLDQAGLELSMPRLNVQLSRRPRRNPRNRTRARRRTAASSATG